MSLFQDSVDTLVAAAGWGQAVPDEKGFVHFHLQGDLDWEMLSPDGRTCFFRADLGALPESSSEADALLEQCAAKVVASCRKRSSVLSLQDGHLVLSRVVPMEAGLLAAVMPQQAEMFLNDLAWWKTQFGRSSRPMSPMDGFGGMNFWTLP